MCGWTSRGLRFTVMEKSLESFAMSRCLTFTRPSWSVKTTPSFTASLLPLMFSKMRYERRSFVKMRKTNPKSPRMTRKQEKETQLNLEVKGCGPTHSSLEAPFSRCCLVLSCVSVNANMLPVGGTHQQIRENIFWMNTATYVRSRPGSDQQISEVPRNDISRKPFHHPLQTYWFSLLSTIFKFA